MNNVILRKLVLTDQYQPLVDQALTGSVTISTPPTNQGTVLFRTRSEPAHEVPWVPGEWHDFTRVDLSQIEVRAASSASAGDIATVVGGTW